MLSVADTINAQVDTHTTMALPDGPPDVSPPPTDPNADPHGTLVLEDNDGVKYFQQDDGTTLKIAPDGSVAIGADIPSGASPEWWQALEAGRQFNLDNHHRYEYNELYVIKDGSYVVLDSYDVTRGEIVSRKFTQLSEIQTDTALSYLRELARKYAPTTTIADVPSTPEALRGTELTGIMILEIPVQTSPVPQAVLDAARYLDVIIRDVQGTVYR